jgi:hypothetical protein
MERFTLTKNVGFLINTVKQNNLTIYSESDFLKESHWIDSKKKKYLKKNWKTYFQSQAS